MLLWCAALAASPELDAIRASWTETEQRIADEQLAVLEVDWNATAMSWPAVGIYAQKLRVYRDTDPDVSPYPLRIVKIVASRTNSTRTEQHAYLYGPEGQLRFVHATNPEHPEVRAYWKGSKLLRVQLGDAVQDPPDARASALADSLRKEATEAWKMALPLVSGEPGTQSLELAVP
jgi:hypothetical protein